MKRRRTNGHFAPGVCAISAGSILLAGCGAPDRAPERHWTAIGRPAEGIVLTKTDTNPRTSPQVVAKRRLALSTGVSTSPFQDYDQAFVDAVKQRWDEILGEGFFPLTEGVVDLEFTLKFDGSVSDIKVVSSTVDEKLVKVCTKAVLDPAPYPAWPATMRKMVGDKRTIRFTFNYLK